VRILIVDSIYEAFAESLYEARPGLADASLTEQYRTIWGEAFGTADAYVHHLNELGHEAHGVITNVPELQRAWMREHGVPARVAAATDAVGRAGPRADLLKEQLVLMAQIRSIKPDVVFIHDLLRVSPRFLEWVRRRGCFLVGQTASRPPSVEVLRKFSLLLSSFPHFVEWFRSERIDSEFFGLGYYSRVSELLARRGVSTAPGDPERSGVVLSGGLDPSTYAAATPALESLCEEADVDVWGYGVEALPAASAIRRRYRGEAWGLDMYELMARARIVINRHNDLANGYANNMRLYEATGVGATLLTEAAPNLETILRPDLEVVTYDSPADLVSTVKELLADPKHAATIAAAGQERTLAEHTYADRMQALSDMLESRIGV
jgi:spore maturation protein CgeB